MNLHEFQGKNILYTFGIKVPLGKTVNTAKLAVLAAEKIYKRTFYSTWVIKAQIYAGGRGKVGGVKILKSLDDVKKRSSEILGLYLVTQQTSENGYLVSKVLIEQYVPLLVSSNLTIKEYYFSILMDRYKSKILIIYSLKGGIDIEEVSKNEQEKIFIEEIDPLYGIHKYQRRKIALNLNLKIKQFNKFIIYLYNAYIGSDAILIEINPLLNTSDNEIMAIDAKIILDDNAFYRHINYLYMCDLEKEDSLEKKARKIGFKLIKLYGNVGCMVNGAGLALATMDLIKISGGVPANFLDIGGTTDSVRIEKAIKLLIKDKKISALFINIFGGIVRCDLVAKGIILALQREQEVFNLPLIVRFHGTNDKKAKKMIDKIGLKIITVFSLKEAATKIHDVL